MLPPRPPIKIEPLHISISDAPSTSLPLSASHPSPRKSTSSTSSNSVDSSSRPSVVHPYARLHAKKEEGKRRRIWNHLLEKSVFTPHEIATLGAPHRRVVYLASLENHVEHLHNQLYSLGYWPIPLEELEPFKGLNSKTAKSMAAAFQHESSHLKLKLLELQRANEQLERTLMNRLDQDPLRLNFDYSNGNPTTR